MKSQESTIQLRINSQIKKKAKKTLADMGLDFSSAIKLFLNAVVVTKSLPFEVRTENGFTVKQEMRMLKETEHALKYGKRYTSVEELHSDLLKD